ncbi:MAG: FAD-dependent oxidoreductase [Thermoproteus sp.]
MATKSSSFDVIIIGGGATGLWSALDLALRGAKVLVLERNFIGSGTSGKFHGLLHSGARYVVTDPKSARECIEENTILSRIIPHTIEDTSGYFVSITKEDEEYKEKFIDGLKKSGIPYEEVPVGEALKEEPKLSREVKTVIEVPDKVIFGLDTLVTIEVAAYNYGALFLENNEVIEIREANDVLEIKTYDKISGETHTFKSSVVINAAGPWAHKVAKAAGIKVDMMPTAGTMVMLARRLTRRVINRMRVPSDGDILVPYDNVSIMGTTAFVVEDPDNVSIPESDIEFLIDEGATMVPELKKLPIITSYISIRPLVKFEESGKHDMKAERLATRDFQIHIHERPKNFISVVGGKFTTARLMGEKIGDVVAEILGINKSSKTRETRLTEYKLDELSKNINIDKDILNRVLSIIYNGMDYGRSKILNYVLVQYYIQKNIRNLIWN